MTFQISRKRRNQRVSDQLTQDITNLIAGKLKNQSMSSIARELNLSLHVIRYVRDNMKKEQTTKSRDLRRAAELYVLSKVGKCTDAFADFEKNVHETLAPVTYERNMKQSLAKLSAGFIPSSERN